jgi:hypothetical protein
LFPSRPTGQRVRNFYAVDTAAGLTLYRIHDLETQGLYSNPAQFYDFLQNRVMIIFRPKYEEADHDRPEFNLILSKKQNYDTVRPLTLGSEILMQIVPRCQPKQANFSGTIQSSYDSPQPTQPTAHRNLFSNVL